MVLKVWIRLSKADNVRESLRPLSFISWLSLTPFRLKTNADKKVYMSKYTFWVGLLHFVLYLYCFAVFEILGVNMVKRAGLISMCTIFGFAIAKRKKLIRIIQKIIFVDGILLRLGIKSSYQRNLRFNFIMGILMVIVSSFLMGIFIKLYSKHPNLFVNLTVLALPHISITVMVFKFLSMTRLVQSRFSLVNEFFEESVNAVDAMKTVNTLDTLDEEQDTTELPPIDSVINDMSVIRQNPEYAIKQISTIHYFLCDICQIIEDYFTYPLLLIVSISFTIIVFDGITILLDMMDPNRLNELPRAYEYLTFVSTEVMWYIVIVFLIVEASSTTITQSSKSAILVHRLINVTEDQKLRNCLLLLSPQLAHQKVSFSAAGLFNLDRTLIFTMAGAATCYLIILIQKYAK